MFNCLSFSKKIYLKGGDFMKKQWQKPKLEVLDASMTMGGLDYKEFDAGWNAGDPIPLDPNGNPLIGGS